MKCFADPGRLLILVFCLGAGCGTVVSDNGTVLTQLTESRLRDWQRIADSLTNAGAEQFYLLDSGWGINGMDTRSLPHTYPDPDSMVNYRRRVTFSHHGILRIFADDGATLFIDGGQVMRLHDKDFPVLDTGNVEISINVMNNAMSGGLKRVMFIPAESYERLQERIQTGRRLGTLVHKGRQAEALSGNALRILGDAFDHPDSIRVAKAEKVLSEFAEIIGPVICSQGEMGTAVSVLTNSNAPVVLNWGVDPTRLENSVAQTGAFAFFQIPHKETNATYYYRLQSGKTLTPVYSFRYHPQASSFSFNVWADSQGGWPEFQENIWNLSGYADAFGVGVGDLVSNGSDFNQWEFFYQVLSEAASRSPYYLIPGNHDYDGYYDSFRPENFIQLTGRSTTWFSWQYGNCAFIALDPNENFPVAIRNGSAQHNWLLNELSSPAWQRANWRFIFIHQPPYSQGWAGYHGDIRIRELLESLNEAYKIDFVVSGHTHDYERLTKQYGKQVTTYLIVGGAGGTLEPPGSSTQPVMDTVIKQHHMGRFFIDSTGIQFKAYDLSGNVIDEFKRSK